jgi:DNA-binding CsgD family transcriptional regulator
VPDAFPSGFGCLPGCRKNYCHGVAALRTPAFRGRLRERRVLDHLLDGVRSGESAVLVIRGEAGVGKTALLHYCARQAAGCRLAQIAGVESELELPFAALHQLCHPMLGGIAALPKPQEEALQVAFGLMTGTAPDRFLVGLAVLSLLAEVGVGRPLVCLVDDAQWLDAASAQVLGFVGRRLLAESVLLLFAVREAGEERMFPALPALNVEGLTDSDAKAILAAAVPGRLDERVGDRMVAETGGNPLALLELVRGMSDTELSGGFVVPSANALSGHLPEHYLSRVRALPQPTQRLMLLAAADPTGDATLLWRAGRALGVGPRDAAVAASEQLLDIGSQVRFRHPLVRSAAYAAGTEEDRAAVHRALADATDPQMEPERRVWHLADAAGGPDENIAVELERIADAVQGRAGLTAAAAFLQRAAALSEDPVQRADRALSAAESFLHAGALDAGRRLLAEAASGAGDDLQWARVEQLDGELDAAAKPGREASLRLLKAASRLETLDIRRARNTYLQAWWAAVLAGRFAAPGGDLAAVCEAARSAPQAPDAQVSDLFLDGLTTMIVESRAAAAPTLRRAVDLFLSDQVSDDDWLQWGRSATTAAFSLWDVACWAELSARQVARARKSGALTSLVLSLNYHGFMTTCCGDFDAATALVAEHDAVKEVTGIRMASYGGRLLAAYQGRPTNLPAQLSASESELVESGDGYALQITCLARAILNNSHGRYADAVAAAREIAYEISFLAPFALSELIEAAAKTGDLEPAREALGQLVTLTVPGSDWAAGMEARGRALVGAGEDAERWYRESLTCLARTPLRPELARAHLLYGEWLRRGDRGPDGRHELRSAYKLFTAMGAEAFAERARRELVAAGVGIRPRHVDTGNALTAQEEHIARLARDGRTNSDIAAELFISARTVEWHLHKVFTKLDITSRKRLADALRVREHEEG